MQIAEFEGASLRLFAPIGKTPDFVTATGVVLEETDNIGSVFVHMHDLNGLINALVHVRNERAKVEAAGAVTTIG